MYLCIPIISIDLYIMARLKNDGRGKSGGRTKGTPNKDKPLKIILRSHSLDYFTQSLDEVDGDGMPTGRMVSQFDIDMARCKPAERVKYEVDILKFHTPQMQATSVDVSSNDITQTLSQRLTALANGEELPDEEE